MTRDRIYLADVVHPRNQNKTFPFAVACLAAYVQQEAPEAFAMDLFASAEALGQAIEHTRPRLVGLTNYVWNSRLSCEIARRIKAFDSSIVVVFGGPNYPVTKDLQTTFLRERPFIDFYVVREGERPFLELARALQAGDWSAQSLKHGHWSTPGVHYVVGDEARLPVEHPRELDLGQTASPYLLGLLDPFFDTDLAPIVQTKRGCPFECTFCVEGDAYYSKLATGPLERIRAELEYIAQRMQPSGASTLFVADSNFGMYEQDLAICDILSDIRSRFRWPATVDVSTGKNRKERVLEAVRRSGGAMRFSPSLQTTDPVTLRNVKRANISESALLDVARSASASGQRTFTELILGLPGETVATHLKSIETAMAAGLQRIKMYPLILLPGTEMASETSREEFGLQSAFRVFPQCYGDYSFLATSLQEFEIAEVVVATSSMSFAEYLFCKRFELSVEIFFNDGFFTDLHRVAAALGLSSFEFVQRCHRVIENSTGDLATLYAQLDEGVGGQIWRDREACEAHYRTDGALREYAANEHKNSLASLKAYALVFLSDQLHEVAGGVLASVVAENFDGNVARAWALFVQQWIEFSRLRRSDLLDSEHIRYGRFDFDFAVPGDVHVDPIAMRVAHPVGFRFHHDSTQRTAIARLLEQSDSLFARARSIVYGAGDPAENPFLRRVDSVDLASYEESRMSEEIA